jgi:SulP family sulfate permease
MKMLIAHSASLNVPALLLGAGTLAILLGMPRLAKRVPGSIVAVLFCTGVSVLFHLHVETIGSRFGGSRAACRRSQYPTFTPNIFCRSFPQHSLSPCWRHWRACSLPLLRTA